MIAEVRERLGTELERLSRQLTDDLGAELGVATAVCAAPEQRREVQQRIRRLGQLVAGLAGLECGGSLRTGWATAPRSSSRTWTAGGASRTRWSRGT